MGIEATIKSIASRCMETCDRKVLPHFGYHVLIDDGLAHITWNIGHNVSHRAIRRAAWVQVRTALLEFKKSEVDLNEIGFFGTYPMPTSGGQPQETFVIKVRYALPDIELAALQHATVNTIYQLAYKADIYGFFRPRPI